MIVNSRNWITRFIATQRSAGVVLANRYELDACLRDHHAEWADDKARESLQGLLILRLKLEAEMLELGGRRRLWCGPKL